MNTALRAWLVGPAVAFALVGCATTSGNLSSSAERLERTSYDFERGADSDYDRDARNLAEEARDFRLTLKDRRADDHDVREAFTDLSRTYHAARDEVERDHSRAADQDFAPVTEAYLDVERAMNASDVRHDRYAGDDRDRYDR